MHAEPGGEEIQEETGRRRFGTGAIPQAKSVEAVVAAWPRRLSQPVNHPTTATCSFGARYYQLTTKVHDFDCLDCEVQSPGSLRSVLFGDGGCRIRRNQFSDTGGNTHTTRPTNKPILAIVFGGERYQHQTVAGGPPAANGN
jgi:hypothetical protein